MTGLSPAEQRAAWYSHPLESMEQVFRKVEWRGECLIWSGSVNSNGYGYIRKGKEQRRLQVHRVVYAETVGAIPEGMYVLHSCDEPLCCNPDHLRPGTHADNMRDRAERGRTFNGRAAYTHCPQRHPYDAANTYVDKRGHRSCRACHRARAAQRRAS